MKRIITMLGVLILSLGVLAACSNNEDKDQNSKGNSSDKAGTDQKSGSNDKDSTKEDDDQSEPVTTDEDTDNKDEEKASSGKVKNQEDLKIGDTGTVKSNINNFELTIKSVKTKDKVKGRQPELDKYIVADVSIKNIGKKEMKAEDVSGVLEVTDDLEASGGSDESNDTQGFEGLKGTIAPGDTLKSKALFQVYDADKYYLVVGSGLADKGAGVMNKLIWTFKASEAK